MKKSYQVLSALLLAIAITSCSDSNAPGKSESSSLPTIVREVLNAKIFDAQNLLLQKGFVEANADAESGTYVYFYPSNAVSEDDKTRENALKNDWVELMCYTEGNSTIQSIEGVQHLSSSAKSFEMMKSWISYMSNLIPNPSLHYVLIQNGGSVDTEEPFIYYEGSVYEHFRTFQIDQLDQLLASGVINTAQYEQEKAKLTITKSDLNRKLASLSIDKEFSIYDVYVELINAYTYTGRESVSIYTNSTKDQDTEMRENCILNHVSYIGNVKESIIDFIVEK